MNTPIQQNHYLKRMKEQGHYRHALGELTMALARMWEKADLQNRRDTGSILVNEFYKVLTQVHGLPDHEARDHCKTLASSFRRT